jgi:hypothetical protein
VRRVLEHQRRRRVKNRRRRGGGHLYNHYPQRRWLDFVCTLTTAICSKVKSGGAKKSCKNPRKTGVFTWICSYLLKFTVNMAKKIKYVQICPCILIYVKIYWCKDIFVTNLLEICDKFVRNLWQICLYIGKFPHISVYMDIFGHI